MKVVLVYPAIAIDGFAQNAQRPKTAWMHHGLCYISAALKDKGHEVSLVDLRRLTGWVEFSQCVRRTMPDVVGITMMSVDFDAAVKAARLVKETDRRIKVFVGGAHPSLMDSELIDNEYIDYIFKGEAEKTLPEILDDIAKGAIPDKVIVGQTPDLDRIPFLDRHLFKTLEAPITPFLKMPFITAIAGRGCMYNCSFCQPAERKMFGAKVRRMSVERFVEELELTRKDTGLNSLMIHDDCLVEDTAWVDRFLFLYSKKKFRKSFVCQSRADIIVKNQKLFHDMKKHGLEMLLIGFESGSQRVLNFLRKGVTVDQNYKAAAICNKLGIRIWANFMLGIPTETNEEVRQTSRMIKAIKPYVASPAFYTPHPGSDLFEFCIKNNLSLIKNHEDYKRNPEGHKVKGVNYEFLKKILKETLEISPKIKLWRKIDKLMLGRFNKELIQRHEIQDE